MAETRIMTPSGSTCGICKVETAQRYKLDNRERIKLWAAEYRSRPGHVRLQANRHRKAKYGISIDEAEALLESQHGRCKICGTTDFGNRGPIVDHDHVSGKVRGMLCHNCNVGIGLFKDNVLALRIAANYIRTNGGI